MGHIPHELISSFMELGLLESEAKIYSALVLFHDADVKELQELLDLSRPSIYEGLRALEDLGMIVLTNDKPTTYQAIPPEIALDMLMGIHLNAKDNALKHIHRLKKESFQDDAPSNLWYIFGSKSLEYKIKDMLENASESVYCITSSRFLDLIERYARSSLKFDIVVVSDDMKAQKRLEKSFGKGTARIRTIKKGELINIASASKAGNNLDRLSSLNQALKMFDFDNMLGLLVDDSEFLYIPPLAENSLNAITTKNKALVVAMKVLLAPVLVDFEPGAPAPSISGKRKNRGAS